MDPIVIPLFFIAAVALASICFVVWAAVKILLFVLYLLLLPVRWLFGGHREQRARRTLVNEPQYSRQGTRCAYRNCMALNPPNARFCGRCGSALSVWGGEHYHYPPKSTTPQTSSSRVDHVA
ncbi:MAG: zinc ribbon domain-containing protein [Planctomycetota bacterium]